MLLFTYLTETNLSRRYLIKILFQFHSLQNELLSIKKYSSSHEVKIKDLIQQFDIYQYNNLIKQSCINLRRKYSLKLPDAIIAATAFAYKIPLLTADKQFSQIEEIEVSLYTL